MTSTSYSVRQGPRSGQPAAHPQMLFDFGPFTLRTHDAVLLRNGQLEPVRYKVFEALRLLLEEHGRIVGRERLLDRVWPGEFVEENSVTQTISLLRRVLNPHFPNQQPIETLSKKGYRLAVPVKVRSEDSARLPGAQGDKREAEPQTPKPQIGQILVFSPSQVADAIIAARGRTTLTATLLPARPEQGTMADTSTRGDSRTLTSNPGK